MNQLDKECILLRLQTKKFHEDKPDMSVMCLLHREFHTDPQDTENKKYCQQKAKRFRVGTQNTRSMRY
jgi:hypothetical protein